MPAPAGAITVLLPIYVQFIGIPGVAFPSALTFLYTLAIAMLMVSRLPVFSGKKVGTRVPPELVLPVFVMVVAFFALLVSYPWEVLTIGSVMFLFSLPFGWLSYQKHLRQDLPAATATSGAAPAASEPESAPIAAAPDAAGDERPARLN
jgi:CDP-diacylglycerol--serine O-phosphatidyltransferase